MKDLLQNTRFLIAVAIFLAISLAALIAYTESNKRRRRSPTSPSTTGAPTRVLLPSGGPSHRSGSWSTNRSGSWAGGFGSGK